MNLVRLEKEKQRKYFVLYTEKDERRWSLFLWFTYLIWAVLKSLSFWEFVKPGLKRPFRGTAWHLELYLICVWTLSALVFLLSDNIPKVGFYTDNDLFATFWSYIILQVVATSFYHEFIRPDFLSRKGVSPAVAHARLRSLIIAMLNYVYVTSIFGLLYYRQVANFNLDLDLSANANDLVFRNLLDAIFFSFTIAWSCGSLSIAPVTLGTFVKLTVIVQIITSIILFSITLANSIAALKTIGENPRRIRKKRKRSDAKKTN